MNPQDDWITQCCQQLKSQGSRGAGWGFLLLFVGLLWTFWATVLNDERMGFTATGVSILAGVVALFVFS